MKWRSRRSIYRYACDFEYIVHIFRECEIPVLTKEISLHLDAIDTAQFASSAERLPLKTALTVTSDAGMANVLPVTVTSAFLESFTEIVSVHIHQQEKRLQ